MRDAFWDTVIERLEHEAAKLDDACRAADGMLPSISGLGDRPLEDFTRLQWRDAGLAASLRETATQVRAGLQQRDKLGPAFATSAVLVRGWLSIRQVECDVAADEAMVELTTWRHEPAVRGRAVALSAYAIGQAHGFRRVGESIAEAQARQSERSG